MTFSRFEVDSWAVALTTLFLLVTTACLYLVHAFYHRDRTLTKNKLQRPHKSNFVSCESPECVRCQKYEMIRQKAKGKLIQFSEFNGSSDLHRIQAAVEFEKSLPSNSLQKPNVVYVPGLRSQPWWTDEQDFLKTSRFIERQWADIFNEYNEVYENASAQWVKNNTKDGVWMVFSLYNQGMKVEGNCKLCPMTTSIVESVSTFMRSSTFGNAMFSVLLPGTSVAEHCGPCNTRIRCHLGLVVPGKTSLTVGRETRTWNPGCCEFFDDSFVHSAVHHGSSQHGSRVVLILDLWHPDLSIKERNALDEIFR